MLPPDLAEIIPGGLEAAVIGLTPDQQVVARVPRGEHLDGLGQRRDAIDGEAFDLRRFAGGFRRENAAFKPFGPGLQGHRERPACRPDAPVQGQFAHNHKFPAIGQGHLLRNGQQADGNGQIVGRPFLAEVGRCQVHHDLPPRNVKTVRHQRRDDAKQALPHGAVGQADQMDADPDRKVDLDGDDDCLNPEAGGAITLVQHGPSSFGYFLQR